jgi:hypothetical protein
MLILGNHFYIANTNELLRYTYQPDMTSLIVKGEKILNFPQENTINIGQETLLQIKVKTRYMSG